jgi:hypothetical protein
MDQQARRQLIKRLERQINDTACLPELGPVQLTILSGILALTPKATVNTVIEYVYRDSNNILDVAHVFATMQGFLEAKLIRDTGKIVTTKGYRPSASFGITEEGKAAITRTWEHLERLQKLVERARAANKMVAKPRKTPQTKPQMTASGP